MLAEHGRNHEAETSILISTGAIVRLAMRMGYHRDSKFYPQITPFQGEMRRRVWTVIRQCDLLFSQQAGVPPTIRPDSTNTELPLNVYDDELYEEMKELPASRPASEPTPVSYVIYKGQLIKTLSLIVDEVQTLKPQPYEKVMQLDRQLREDHANIPPVLKMRSLEESLGDSAEKVMRRFILNTLYLKSMCILHRKYSGLGGEKTSYSYSRRICVESAADILRHQATLAAETRPGGRLFEVRWFHTSLSSTDYLLSAMLVGMELYQSTEAQRPGGCGPVELYDYSKETRAGMIALLEQALGIWGAQKEEGVEAFKAFGIITTLLAMVRGQIPRSSRQAGNENGDGICPSFTPSGRLASQDEAKLGAEHSAAMTLGMLSAGGLAPGATPGNTVNMFGSPGTSSFDSTSPGGLQTQPFLTPPSDTGSTAPAIGASPFSALFGSGMGFQSMDMPAANIDWVSSRGECGQA
jgi:hypothetical protein